MAHESMVLAPNATMPAAEAFLGQLRAFLDGLDAEAYTAPSEALGGGTIGRHIRHTLDHFAAALDALEGGVISYDRRGRGTEVETDPEEACRVIDVLRSLIHAAPANQADRLVTVRVMLTAEGEEAELTSTFARELAFASHHAVHHMAMVSSIARERGVSAPDGFGKAPSTLVHERAGGGA